MIVVNFYLIDYFYINKPTVFSFRSISVNPSSFLYQSYRVCFSLNLPPKALGNGKIKGISPVLFDFSLNSKYLRFFHVAFSKSATRSLRINWFSGFLIVSSPKWGKPIRLNRVHSFKSKLCGSLLGLDSC